MNLKHVKLRDLCRHLTKPQISRKDNVVHIIFYDEEEAKEVIEEMNQR